MLHAHTQFIIRSVLQSQQQYLHISNQHRISSLLLIYHIYQLCRRSDWSHVI